MARVGILGFIAVIVLVFAFHGSVAVIRPISDAHRSAALELFAPIDGSYASLEEAYKALRTFQILGLEKGTDVSETTCKLVVGKLMSSESSSEDLFHVLKVNSILKCQIDSKPIEGMISKLKDAVKNAGSLLEYHHSVESLLQIKNLGHDVTISDADGVFHSLKTLSQSDGRWRYESASAQSSSYAAGIALETLAGVISLASSDLDQSMIGIVKKDIVKLFDSIRSYNDGTLYFDEKYIDGNEYKSPLIVSASVLRGTMAFSQVVSEKLNISGDKIVGLAKFFLSIGIPGSSNDLFNQLDSLSLLENNRISIPLVLSLPATVLSLTTKDQLKAEVTTVFGSAVSPLTVNLVKVFTSGTENSPVLENQVLPFDQENNIHYLDIVPLKLDAGKYTMVFEISLQDPELANTYSTGGQTITSALLTGTISIDKAEIAILNSDNGGEESVQKLDLSKENTLSLSANHLQKLRLSLKLSTPLGHSFKPHQVLLKLSHETKVKHIFVLDVSARQFKITLDFLGLLDKFYYLSGKYDMELTVGDAAMENSFSHVLGYIDLDFPEAPERAPRPPPQPLDPYLRFGPKQEISHIFRSPEKRPPKELSYVFLAVVFLPLFGFLIGLVRLGANMKGFPSSTLPAVSAVLFHSGIAAILLLYALFWLKLNLFTTLKALGFLGMFLVFVGHRTLSHLAASSSKLKSS